MRKLCFLFMALGALLLPAINVDATAAQSGALATAVTQAIEPVMKGFGVPGMAIGVVANGRAYVFNYGVASKITGNPVADNTLFEVGSVSKTLTATLTSYAQVTGKLSLASMASQYVPSLRGTAFDKVSLLNLGTHTAGLPFMIPASVTNDAEMMTYFHDWKPLYAPGSHRTYGNMGIGLLGIIAAKSMGDSYVSLMQNKLFPWLGMRDTYVDVPQSQMTNYAQGYTSSDAPIRMTHGALWSQTYGVRTTAGDLARFLEANMGMIDLNPGLQRAITATHTGYYQIGPMTQDLMWEQFHYPVSRTQLLAGNSDKMLFDTNPAAKLDPPLQPQSDVLINKTGSTNGFSTYVAFVPAKKIGVVILANKSYPIADRVKTAYAILKYLDAEASGRRAGGD